MVAEHEEEGAEADRNDRHRRKVAAALLGVEIAKRKPVWEKSPSAPEWEIENQKEPGGFGTDG